MVKWSRRINRASAFRGTQSQELRRYGQLAANASGLSFYLKLIGRYKLEIVSWRSACIQTATVITATLCQSDKGWFTVLKLHKSAINNDPDLLRDNEGLMLLYQKCNQSVIGELLMIDSRHTGWGSLLLLKLFLLLQSESSLLSTIVAIKIARNSPALPS